MLLEGGLEGLLRVALHLSVKRVLVYLDVAGTLSHDLRSHAMNNVLEVLIERHVATVAEVMHSSSLLVRLKRLTLELLLFLRADDASHIVNEFTIGVLSLLELQLIKLLPDR